MELTFTLELESSEVAELQRIEGKRFLSAGAMVSALERLIRRQLGEPVLVLGPLHSVTYRHPDQKPDAGKRHVFARSFRPELVWTGHGLQTRGGAFRVSDIVGIVETGRRSPRRGK